MIRFAAYRWILRALGARTFARTAVGESSYVAVSGYDASTVVAALRERGYREEGGRL